MRNAGTTEGISYFDHAATSWPKPQPVIDAVVHALTKAGGNPGRSAHAIALAASRLILESRTDIASLLGVPNARDIAFVPGCTAGLNLVLKGLLKPGDRVVVGSTEHNAVARPLHALAAAGVRVDVVQADQAGRIDPYDVERVIAEAPTRVVVCQHASNVLGTIQPVGDLADIAHEVGAYLVVDGAQGAGHLKVNLAALGADAYVASGHKGLLGPQGVGVLYLAPGVEPVELVQGGGGSNSEDPVQPVARPDRYEAGTPNTPGIAGLGAAARLLSAEGDAIRATERRLTRMLHEALVEIPGLRVLGPPPAEERVPVVSVVHDRVDSDRIAFELDSRYLIAVRAGLHCAPWAHATAGTGGSGAVRFGIGYGVTEHDVERAIRAMHELCA
jgi:cysteine desulfurase family protein